MTSIIVPSPNVLQPAGTDGAATSSNGTGLVGAEGGASMGGAGRSSFVPHRAQDVATGQSVFAQQRGQRPSSCSQSQQDVASSWSITARQCGQRAECGP